MGKTAAVPLFAIATTAFALTACIDVPGAVDESDGIGVQVSRNTNDDHVDDGDTKTVTVRGKQVTLGSAAGYCINDSRSRYTASGAFVVMAPCKPGARDATARGLVLVNVLASQALQDAVKAEQLDAFFKSKDGRAALSARGRSSDIEVLGTMENDGVFVIHARDAAGPVIPDTSEDIWRTFLSVHDRLVSVSIVNFTDAPMSDGVIFAQMEEIAQRIQALND